MKTCSKCLFSKEDNQYCRSGRIKDGLQAWCKMCSKVAYVERYAKNRKKIIATSQIWQAANRDRVLEISKAWGENNRQHRNTSQGIRRAANPDYKFERNLRSRIYAALRGKNKSARTLELVGCTIDELKAHLQSRFTEEMTFENYGQWHVDHIKPCASFDLTDAEQQKACFHFLNLQPLWALDNIRKGANIIHNA